MRWKFILLIFLQVVLLVGIIGYRQYWVEANERILLESVPVDPRDIFRGDYVTLSYDISNIDLDTLEITEKFERNDIIYAILKKTDAGTYKMASVSKAKPAEGKFIKGRVTYAYDKASRKKITIRQENGSIRVFEQPWFYYKVGDNILFCLGDDGRVITFREVKENTKCPDNEEAITGIVLDIQEIIFRRINAEYGIEHYFVEEGKGRVIETARNARDLKIEVALRPDGKGLITALYLGGKRIE